MTNDTILAKGISSEILELLPDAVLLVNDQGTIQYVNSRTREMFGYENAELLGQRIEILVPKKDRIHHTAHRESYTKRPTQKLMSKREELFGQRKDGSHFSVEISIGPITISNNVSVIAIVRDTTSRQYMELLEGKNKELEQFAYIASHDLQEPLRTVNSFTALLERQYKGRFDQKADKYLQYISQASTRMSALVKGLLDYSRIGQDKQRKDVDCNAIMKAVQDDLASTISETNTILVVDQLPQIRGYETELRLLFQNLISNAIKFCRKGITPQIKISAQKENNYWKFAFQDNGIGIAPEHKERIFVIFQRLHKKTEYEGTGIGLAHCQKIVDLHLGKIWVESQPEKGSTFYVLLPN